MPKGGGSSRIRLLGADMLEGRRLLSHVGAVTSPHAPTPPTVQVTSLPTPSHPETESGHTTTTAAVGDVEARDNDGFAATTATSTAANAKGTGTFPLITPLRTSVTPDELEIPGQGLSEGSRYFRAASRDEPVAWGLVLGSAPGLGTLSRHGDNPTLAVPEFSVDFAVDPEVEPTPARTAAPEPARGPSPSPGSDILDEFLPSDRVTLEEAIDRLLDDLEGAGADLSERIEATGSISSPIAWGVSIAAMEAVRRRLRKAGVEEDDATDPDRDPAVGFLDYPA